jgi:PadR family transcriptional regulator, regulatory protein PadR
MDSNLLKGNLELILLSIIEGQQMYGLEITKELQARSDGYFRCSLGSLYPALHRLEQSGWLESEFRPSPRGGSNVKYYWLSTQGQAALHDKRRGFQQFDQAMRLLWKP